MDKSTRKRKRSELRKLRKRSELRRLSQGQRKLRKRSELRRLRKGQTMLKQSQRCLTKPICRTQYQIMY